MEFARVLAVVGLIGFGVQVLALVRGRPRPGAGAAVPGPGTDDAVLAVGSDEAAGTAARAWTLLWRAGATALLLRLALFLLVGLTPAGVLVLRPLSQLGWQWVYPATLVALVLIALVPWVVVRPWRQAAFRLAPQLRPQPWTGVAGLVRAFQWVLVLVLVVTVGSSFGSDSGSGSGVALVGCLVLFAVSEAVARARAQGPAGVVPDAALSAQDGVNRLIAARDSLTLPAAARAVRLLVGHRYGLPPAVTTITVRDGDGWAVVVAPELLGRLSDRQVRALVARELGRQQRPQRSRHLLGVTWLASALGLAWWLPQAFWFRLTDVAAGSLSLPESLWPAYAQALLAASTAAVGYAAHLLLRPFVLWASRADEAVVDGLMVAATGDPDGCAEYLGELARVVGVPRRWSPLQLLLTATQPAPGPRIAALGTTTPAA